MSSEFNSRSGSMPLQPAAGANPPPAPRPSVIQLVFKEKGALYAAYIPLFAEGGLFVPTTRDYRLGDDVYLLLTLPEDPQRYPVAGKVAWVTPAGAQGNRTAGIGVQFADSAEGEAVKNKIEAILAGILNSDKPTHTM